MAASTALRAPSLYLTHGGWVQASGAVLCAGGGAPRMPATGAAARIDYKCGQLLGLKLLIDMCPCMTRLSMHAPTCFWATATSLPPHLGRPALLVCRRPLPCAGRPWPPIAHSLSQVLAIHPDPAPQGPAGHQRPLGGKLRTMRCLPLPLALPSALPPAESTTDARQETHPAPACLPAWPPGLLACSPAPCHRPAGAGAHSDLCPSAQPHLRLLRLSCRGLQAAVPCPRQPPAGGPRVRPAGGQGHGVPQRFQAGVGPRWVGSRGWLAAVRLQAGRQHVCIHKPATFCCRLPPCPHSALPSPMPWCRHPLPRCLGSLQACSSR